MQWWILSHVSNADACKSEGSQHGILIFITELVPSNVGAVMLGEMWVSGVVPFSRNWWKRIVDIQERNITI